MSTRYSIMAAARSEASDLANISLSSASIGMGFGALAFYKQLAEKARCHLYGLVLLSIHNTAKTTASPTKIGRRIEITGLSSMTSP